MLIKIPFLKYLLSPIQVHKGKPFSESVLEMNAAAADVSFFASRDICYIFVFIIILPLLLGSRFIVPFPRQVVSSRNGTAQKDFELCYGKCQTCYL